MTAIDYPALSLAGALALLFISSFVAATLIPLSSEVVLAGLLAAQFEPWLLLIVALVGNTLGASVNWFLGYRGIDLLRRKLSPFNARQLDRGTRAFKKFGILSLLFSWLPIVGDPLTFAAGVLKVPFATFLLPVAFGKAVRYLVVMAAALHFA